MRKHPQVPPLGSLHSGRGENVADTSLTATERSLRAPAIGLTPRSDTDADLVLYQFESSFMSMAHSAVVPVGTGLARQQTGSLHQSPTRLPSS